MLCSQGLLDKLSSCTGLTKYCSNNETFFKGEKKLDLHNCTSLENMDFRGFEGSIWLPKNDFQSFLIWAAPKNLKISFSDPSGEEEVNKSTNIKFKSVQIENCKFWNTGNWTFLKNLSCESFSLVAVPDNYDKDLTCGINYESVLSLRLGEYYGGKKDITEDLTRFRKF